jgi:phage gp29-like protein
MGVIARFRASTRAAWRAFADIFSGQIVRRSRLARFASPLSTITPQAIANALLQASSVGDLTYIGDIHDKMPATDSHLRGVRDQLRAGVAGITMGVVPIDKSAEAQKVADLVRLAEERPGINNRTFVDGVIEGRLRGAAVVEVYWEDPGVGFRFWKGFGVVPEQELRYDINSGQVLLVADPLKSFRGLPLSAFPAGKFIRIQVDEEVPDFSMRGVYRSLIADWNGRLDVKQWELTHLERYGMPIPVGKAATAEARKTLTDAAGSFGAAGMLIVDSESSVEMASQQVATSGNIVHEVYLAASAERISLALLGATQTATIAKDAGSKQSADTHAGIRRDILFAITDQIAECKRRDLWIPFVRMNLGEQYVKFTPKCVAEFDEPIDLKTTAEAWDILINRIGLPISKSYAYGQTGIEEVGPEDELLKGAPPAPAPLNPFGQPAPMPPALPAASDPLLPPPLPFMPKPKQITAATTSPVSTGPERQAVSGAQNVPVMPDGFGAEIADDLKRIVNAPKSTGALKELPARLRNAMPPTIETTDMLAAGMLEATMRALSAARKGSGA